MQVPQPRRYVAAISREADGQQGCCSLKDNAGEGGGEGTQPERSRAQERAVRESLNRNDKGGKGKARQGYAELPSATATSSNWLQRPEQCSYMAPGEDKRKRVTAHTQQAASETKISSLSSRDLVSVSRPSSSAERPSWVLSHPSSFVIQTTRK